MRQVVCQCTYMHFYISVFILALYYFSKKKITKPTYPQGIILWSFSVISFIFDSLFVYIIPQTKLKVSVTSL